MEKDVKEFSTATEKLIQVDIEKEMRCRYSGNDSIWSF